MPANHPIPCYSLSRFRRTGFTLIELLVVVIIIVILAAVGLGVFGKMREKARSTVSAGNLRQWGQALSLYLGESNGEIPYEGDADRMTWARIATAPNAKAWFNVLPPYVGGVAMSELGAQDRAAYTAGRGIHHCPFVEWRDSRVPNFSYMMNSQIYNPNGPSDTHTRPINAAQIREPGFTVMFADLNQNFNDRPRGRGRHVDDRQPGGKVNIVFFDGSLRSYDAEYVRSETFSDSTGNYSDNNKPDIVWNPWIHSRTVGR